MIQPSDSVLHRWSAAFTTEQDVWYWDDEAIPHNLEGCDVMTRSGYLADPYFREISYVNAYWHWRMSASVTRVIVANPAWIGAISAEERNRVLAKQIELDRGLILPQSHFDHLPESLAPYSIGEKIVLGRTAWKALDQARQFTALRREILQWDDAECFPIPAGTPGHIRKIANAYGDQHGTNCLSTTAYCITGQQELRQKWMFQPEFLTILKQEGFTPVADLNPRTGDVIAFRQDGTVVHAAWCMAPDRFVNKNGQSMFNPVRIVNRAMLDADWSAQDVSIYRPNVS